MCSTSTTTSPNLSQITNVQTQCAQSLITAYFGRDNLSNNSKDSSAVSEIDENETNDIDLLRIQMQIRMAELDSTGWNDEAVDLFFVEIDKLQSKIKALVALNSNSSTKSTVRNDNGQEFFTDLSLLPIYYNNVRCITSKRNICIKIDLSVYKDLCCSET